MTGRYRSPAVETPDTSRDSGGWGLVASQIDNPRADDDEDEPSDWEQAQVRAFAESTRNGFNLNYRLPILGNSDEGRRNLCLFSLNQVVPSVKYRKASVRMSNVNQIQDVVSLPNAQGDR